MKLFSYDDPTWVKDFQEALRDLSGEQLLLPGPDRIEPTCLVAVTPAEEADISTLHGATLRMAILERMHVKKCPNPYIRQVYFEGLVIGEIARSPWQPLEWISSCDRSMPFYSMVDAAVYTVAEHLGVER
jgi:hypothetical protein